MSNRRQLRRVRHQLDWVEIQIDGVEGILHHLAGQVAILLAALPTERNLLQLAAALPPGTYPITPGATLTVSTPVAPGTYPFAAPGPVTGLKAEHGDPEPPQPPQPALPMS